LHNVKAPSRSSCIIHCQRNSNMVNAGIQRTYRRVAPFYDLILSASLAPGRRAAIDALRCRPGERVLELCVGSGLSLPLYPAWLRVIGIDLSRDMLRRARARIAAKQLPQVEALLQMDAGRLAFADGSFDKVLMLFALTGLADRESGMREIQRVCRPDGTIVIAEHFRARGPWLRVCEWLLAPMYRWLGYRPDLELEPFVAATQLEVLERRRVNLFGYATLLVCRNRASLASTTHASVSDRNDVRPAARVA
jgi:phosphatidylethanolamine/phosphatidyl-N-methylethanolamine N-methyltransferase